VATKSFAFLADTVNGKIFESPVTVVMKCSQVTPIGMQTIRDFDIEYCIVATDVYLVLYKGDTYGSSQFKNFDDFQVYMAGQCKCCSILCTFTINCCNATINGCAMTFETSKQQCTLYIGGCPATINGQNLNYFSNN
jgi:hypothetical protein